MIARRPKKNLAYDAGLLSEVPPGVEVHRARSIEFSIPERLLWRAGYNSAASEWLGLYFPDSAVGWLPDAYRLACKAASQTKFEAVVAVSAPPTAHLIGMLVAKRFDLPLVLDYKDEWCDSPYIHFTTAMHRRAAEKLEHAMLERADRVIAVTNYFRKRIQARADGSGGEKVFTLENGYDERAFDGCPAYRPNAKFTIAYVGSYYGMNSPAALFGALEILLQSGRIPISMIRFQHVGQGRYEVPKLLESIVERKGFVPQREALATMCQAELLTQTLPDPAPQSGKVFDYLRAGRPILAIAPKDGMLAELLVETKGGETVEPGDVAGLADVIHGHYLNWKSGRDSFQPRVGRVRDFEWGRLTERFLGHVEEAVRVHLHAAR